MTEVADAPSTTDEHSESNEAAGRSAWHRHGRVLVEWAIVLVGAVALAVVVRTYVIQTYYIPSASMVPTLQIGDRIVVLKAAFRVTSPAVGDVVVFHAPPDEGARCGGPDVSTLVKRIVATPGQTIWSSGNTIMVDSHPLAQPWPHVEPLGTPIPRQTVGSNQYFMLGDNHPESCDSRVWGTVSRNALIGKAVLVFWPLSHVGTI